MPGIVYNVAEIKKQVREFVSEISEGASGTALIHSAEIQIQVARTFETNGELKNSLRAYATAASLTRTAIDGERKDHEAAMQKFGQFMGIYGPELTERVTTLSAQLESMNPPNEQQSMPSIADRMRQLEGNGLKLAPSSSASTAASSSAPPSPALPGSPGLSSFPPQSPLVSSSASSAPSARIPATSGSNKHTFAVTSSLGSPSPTKTDHPTEAPPSSATIPVPVGPSKFQITPILDHVPSPSEFARDFPSVDDLDQDLFPSPPAVAPPTAFNPSTSPIARRFALGNGVERPGSTPLTPTSFASRPASPAPTRKSSRTIPNTNLVSPTELRQFIREYKVLLIDIRHRQQFDEAHIKASPVVCIEPTILRRDGITAEKIEEALVVGPKQEASVFLNRDKFDIVALYDNDSTGFGERDGLPHTFVRVIHEQTFKKILKRVPMLLIGGFQAWKEQIGPTEIEGSTSSLSNVSTPERSSGTAVGSPLSPAVNGSFGFSSASASASASHRSSPSLDPHQVWTPHSRSDNSPPSVSEHRSHYSLDQSSHSRAPAEFSPSMNGYSSSSKKPLARPPSRASISQSQPIMNGTASITYPSFQSRKTASSLSQSPSSFATISPPPQASISSSSLTRRRSDYIDQSQEALASSSASTSSSTLQSFGSISTNFVPRTGSPAQMFHRSIDYPNILPSSSSQQPNGSHILQPPPPAVQPTLERQRPSLPSQSSSPYSNINGSGSKLHLTAPEPPRIGSAYPVTYWSSSEGAAGTTFVRTGLKNLGNTCYMNATVQCLSASIPVVRFFTDTKWQNGINYMNKLGTRGILTSVFAGLLAEMVRSDVRFLSPSDFRKTIAQLRPQYAGTDQHDSQEFLSFLLDGVHEDMNRVLQPAILNKTPEEEEELEQLPVSIASEKEWHSWKRRNDSIIVDYFQGQFRNRLECLVCSKTSTTYNVFSMLQVPIPHSRSQRVPLQSCLEALFNTEILEKDDAWDCPRCKTKRQARKQLSLARLPPILLIHLKRFQTHGRFSDKIDSFVDFPLRNLDLTGFMPESQGHGHINKDDPRAQAPPYKYDLYGVTNHTGNLSSGHYTAFIQSRDKWMFCEDSTVKESDASQVVTQRAYVLFYRRTRFY